MFDDDTKRNPGRFPSWVTPVLGGLAGFSLASYEGVFGWELAAYIVIGTAAARLLSFMDALEDSDDSHVAPNPSLTKFLLVASALLFWIPVAGLILFSYAMYRARWLDLSDGIGCLLSGLFVLSLVATLVWGIIVSIEG